jgi:hypothetical protein
VTLDRNVLVICLTIFGTVSSVAWAVAFVNVYGPVTPPKSAKEVCALYESARNTPFCIEVARQASHQAPSPTRPGQE